LARRSAKLPGLAREQNSFPSLAERQARGARQRFFLRKTKFSILPSALLGALAKKKFKKMFCSLPSARLEALGKEIFKNKIVLLFAER